ncbi:asparagine synthase (glutamine-hydrolyzing) [Streptomyces tropicalis]|uniref:asparagine synthase (glutamine-hydrolyzing) n=1 Tax=Streptomyces tropicalis TaxID=3034234 RepID=A0ABT6A1C4_9ACTN|nr:asparagine synthase (glutamine-hydrolyzing) [Streptomyces tropicalis]MDF3297620.1 asparagine synthase (glutamine-hydrolyzing) [Streptomyces tropicalis]
MCGVAGMVSTTSADQAVVKKMCDVLAHRGPDGEGFHTGTHVSLGMRRLAVIDVEGGDQPVFSEDRGVVAVFNGEIYNYRDLRRELLSRGHTFRTNGDGECIVHLYEEHGEDLVHHLRGMFALAVWDAGNRRLLLARDRVGKKPLFYQDRAGSLTFASELKALSTVAEAGREVDPEALHHYLTYQYVPAPWSILRGIRKLPPGSLLTWHDGRVRVRRYWELDFSPADVASEEEAAERTRELLLEATRLRMVSERPLGAFLSGGIDSSAVVAAMARISDRPVKTFAIGFDDARFDERTHARAVARRYGTDHHEFVVDASALDVLPTLAWYFDEPFADSSAIPSFYVAQLSRRHVTVALNGDGGDETFGGYTRYARAARLERFRVHRAAHPALRHLGRTLVGSGQVGTHLRRAGLGLAMLGETSPRRYARMMSYFTPEQKQDLYTAGMCEATSGRDSYDLLDQAFRRSRATDWVNRLMDVDVNTYLPGDLLVKVDITTMANSLEGRSPFLDHHLMEWAARLPAELKVRGGTTKYLLKKALRDWLPHDVLHRPKQGFGVPLAHWLRTDLRDVARDVLTDRTATSRGYFRPEAVSTLLEEHVAGSDHARRLWALMQFELWHRRFVDQPLSGAPAATTQSSRCIG